MTIIKQNARSRQAWKVHICTISIPNSNSKDKVIVIDSNNSTINYFIQGPQQEEQVQKLYKNYIRSSTMYSLKFGVLMVHSHCRQRQKVNHIRLAQGMWPMPYKSCLRRNMSGNSSRTSSHNWVLIRWCAKVQQFLLVPKPNWKVTWCLDPARLKEALTWPFHRGPTINDMFPKLTNTNTHLL